MSLFRKAAKIQKPSPSATAALNSQLVLHISSIFSLAVDSGDDITMLKDRVASTSAQTTELSATTEELDRNTRDVLELVKETSESARAMSDASKEGGKVVNEMLTANRALAGATEESTSLIHELSQDSERIGKAVTIIDSVANQTNLLSLNAAIEAAKAGEQGKGFAVVADEVRTLAGRAAEASRSIRESVEVVQDKVKKTLAKFDQISQMAQNNLTHSDAIQEAFEAIMQMADSVTEVAGKLDTSMEEQASAISETARTVEALSEELREEADRLEDSLDPAVHQMVKETGLMDQAVFKLDISDKDLLETAIKDHQRWVHRIKRMLKGEIHLSADASLADPHKCRLGKWYFNLEHPRIQAQAEAKRLFEAMDAPHARIHQTFYNLIQAHQQGKNTSSLEADLKQCSEVIVGNLEKLAEII
ncbi:MAG: methyl-accepting chemotaxis protein [bacterium]|nr:methyl-accepting chemotaxis protein [bacterium]